MQRVPVGMAAKGGVTMAKKMDKLTLDAAAALAAGMSYGKWKAMQPTPAKPKPVPVLPDGWKQGPWCNVHFKANGNQKYCDIQCQKQAQKAREKGVVV